MKTASVSSLFPLTVIVAIASLTAIFLNIADAQVPDQPRPAPSSNNSAPATSSSNGGSSSGSSNGSSGSNSLFGNLLPSFNPGTELVTWNGQNWNINNNRLFEARFEKYLNAPEETSADDKAYQEIIAKILDDLAPQNLTNQSLDEAFRLLPKAANYEIDARLCDTLADTVYSIWRSQQASSRLANANETLQEQLKQEVWQTKVDSQTKAFAPPGVSTSNNTATARAIVSEWQKDQDQIRTITMQPHIQRIAELNALLKANQAKDQLSQLQAKIAFQAQIVQFFLQRRFQHVLMATRFYRAVYANGDTTLQVGKDANDLFSRTTGEPPTVSTLDTMANEAIRDVNEGVSAFEFLLKQGELESATKRLAEAFVVGEYVPSIRTLPRAEKRQVLKFAQDSNQLISALDVKDYTLAEKLVGELQKEAKDFDPSKPLTAIQTARTIASMHIAKARNAAVSGDKVTLENELKAATEIWPLNPQLSEVSQLIFKQGDVQQQALVELDQLISEKNYRQIWDNKVRYIAATALYPDKQKQLSEILQDMETIEGSIIRANEIAKHGDYAGAWESIEQTYEKYPNDSKLNQVRADLTTQAADFVRTLRAAQSAEQAKQTGSSLALFLKAQKLYPASEFAKEGIDRLVKTILPESSGS